MQEGAEDLVSLLFHMSKEKDNCEIPEQVGLKIKRVKKLLWLLCVQFLPLELEFALLSTQLERKVMQTGKATRFLLLQWHSIFTRSLTLAVKL